eukprot:CAMPEP_0202702454 /NCGR_PEP_ID=MMETSP1385-20130828/15429_1 /ASSEMBLY_ACC=CAM_ASM_000861 /TAXON_ID=933848 /ORGANISM="Elphidium margaritaceum" /LENGTH=403 /DNA_ID=CAMNT_0049360111 /DNA_START=289 /DNA_END=1500 /DNA_ORIENTATION=+
MCDSPLRTYKAVLDDAWNAVFATNNGKETALPQWIQCTQCKQWRTTMVAVDEIREWQPCKTWQCSENNISPKTCSESHTMPSHKTHPFCSIFALELQRQITTLKPTSVVDDQTKKRMREFLQKYDKKFNRRQQQQSKRGVQAAEASASMNIDFVNDKRQTQTEAVYDENVNRINHSHSHDAIATNVNNKSMSTDWTSCGVCTMSLGVDFAFEGPKPEQSPESKTSKEHRDADTRTDEEESECGLTDIFRAAECPRCYIKNLKDKRQWKNLPSLQEELARGKSLCRDCRKFQKENSRVQTSQELILMDYDMTRRDPCMVRSNKAAKQGYIFQCMNDKYKGNSTYTFTREDGQTRCWTHFAGLVVQNCLSESAKNGSLAQPLRSERAAHVESMKNNLHALRLLFI